MSESTATPVTRYDLEAEGLRALEPGWDGYGAPKISEAAIQAALRTLRDTGKLTPLSSGGVQIDFQSAEIAFKPNGEQEWDDEILSTIFRPIPAAYLEVHKKRRKQDDKWGGPDHDDTHLRWDWVGKNWSIPKYVDRARHLVAKDTDVTSNAVQYEDCLLHVAALAIAAVQSSRRKRGA